MPFRTKSGTHYHMTEGCCNAFIQCDTKGLEPCSICCGGAGKGDNGGGGPAGAPGAGSPMAGADGEYAKESPSDGSIDMLGVIAKACDEGDSVILPNGYTLIFREAWETGLPEDGYVLEEPIHGNPVRMATKADMDDAARQLRDGIADLGSGTDWRRYAPSGKSRSEAMRDTLADAVTAGSKAAEAGTRGNAPLSMAQGAGSIDLSILDGMGAGTAPATAPIPPMPRNLGDGGDIDVDGTIIRDGSVPDGDRGTKEMTQRRASELVRRFDSAAPARWPSPDYAERARGSLVSRIDGAVSDMPEDRREEFRRTAQAAWNTMHPEAPILEWSRDDDGYVSDSETSVVKRWRTYDEMRDFNHGSNEIGYGYGVFDKATGEDVTDEIHHRDLVVRQVDRRIDDIEGDMRARAQREISRQRAGIYQDWLDEKRRQSDLYKYHGGSLSWDRGIRDELEREFRSDTGYTEPEPVVRPTDDEREELARLYQRKRDARSALDEIMLRHGIDDEVVELIRPQYMRRR